MTTTDKPTKQTTLFRRAAREHEADVSPERFDAALKAVGRHKPSAENGAHVSRPRKADKARKD
jgi:hypothetical protein